MKIADALKIIDENWVKKQKGFRACLQRREGSEWVIDYSPGEKAAPLDSDVATWRLAWKLAQSTPLRDGDPQEGDMIISHGYSYFGDLQYPADYTHFSYVNPDAPKGGEISLAVGGTFDSMNPYTRKGRSGALSTVMYESLLGQVLAGSGALPADAPNDMYGLLAEGLE